MIPPRASARPASRVTCIIPAYNEAERIGAVIEAVIAQPLISEVIVVDDGSADDTVSVARAYPGIEVLAMPQNGGKSKAVAAGIAKATGDHLLLVDADLTGIGPDDLARLIEPVVHGHAEVSLSLRRNAPWLWHKIGIDYISGERVLPAKLLANRIPELEALPGFGLEVWMNQILVAARTPIAIVKWGGVDSPFKSSKHGLLRGVLADIGMLRDMFKQVGPLKLLRQIMAMRRLRIRMP